MNQFRLFGTCALFTALAGGTAEAQSITLVLLEGDAIPGVGNVTSINNLDVNDSGEWLIEADTDADAAIDNLILTGGPTVVVQQGDSAGIAALPAATINSYDSVRLNNLGNRAHNHTLADTIGTNDNTGIYFNDLIVIQEGTFSTSVELSPMTPYTGFFEVAVNESNQLFTIASINDPALGTTTTDRVLMLIDIDPMTGMVIGETVIAKEDDQLPGMTLGTMDDIETGPHDWDINGVGDVLWVCDIDTPDNGDKAIYLNDTTLIAEEGTAEPLTGRNYEFLTRAVSLNDSNDFAFQANLDGDAADDEVIFKDVSGTRSIVAREGDAPPTIGSFLLTGFGSTGGPLHIDNSGNVLWYGDWDDPDTDVDTGLFFNDQLLVQEGVTLLNGVPVDTIGNVQDTFAMSRSGRYILFEAQLPGLIDGVWLIDMQGVSGPVNFASSCNGDGGDQMGCTPCPCSNEAMAGTTGGCLNSALTAGQLLVSGSSSVGAADLRFEADGLVANSFAVLTSGDDVAPTNMMNPCFGQNSGVQSVVLDGLRCAVTNTQRHGGRPVAGDGTVGVSNNGWGPPNGPMGGIAAQGGFVSGQTRYFQAFYRELPGMVCSTEQNTSQAVTVIFAP